MAVEETAAAVEELVNAMMILHDRRRPQMRPQGDTAVGAAVEGRASERLALWVAAAAAEGALRRVGLREMVWALLRARLQL